MYRESLCKFFAIRIICEKKNISLREVWYIRDRFDIEAIQAVKLGYVPSRQENRSASTQIMLRNVVEEMSASEKFLKHC